jgi:uncharacterized YigZ family protein
MNDTYKTICDPAQGMFRDRNSRFIALGFPVESVIEINHLLGQVKKQYHDARHHCFAYRLGVKKNVFRMNDDGEPSGTAGKPIYGQLLSFDVTNILAVVVRYFGGTLLGTGGLINAYKSAAFDMLSHAKLTEKYLEQHIQLQFSYEQLGSVMKVLKEFELSPHNATYSNTCSLMLTCRESYVKQLSSKLAGIHDVNMVLKSKEDENHSSGKVNLIH